MAVPSVGSNRSRAERVIWRRSREVLRSQRVMLLLPGIGKDRSGRLKFIPANIHGATHGPRVAVEISCAPDVGIIPGIDAWGVGLEAQVGPPARVHEQRRAGDVAETTCLRRRAGIVQEALDEIPARVEVDETVVQGATIGPAAIRMAVKTAGGRFGMRERL
jgi:hypothetical protein